MPCELRRWYFQEAEFLSTLPQPSTSQTTSLFVPWTSFMCRLKLTTLLPQMSHQLFLPRTTRQGQFLPSLFSRLVNSVRVAQMVFIRILILEHLATHLALDLIVSRVNVSHMPVELRPTDVFITLLAIHLACNSTHVKRR